MIEIGAKLTVEKTVTPELTAQVAGSGLLPVFGTPFMTAMMENAAAGILQQYLVALGIYRSNRIYKQLTDFLFKRQLIHNGVYPLLTTDILFSFIK